MLENVMIVLTAAYVGLVILGHILLISAIYKCTMDGPGGNLVRWLPKMLASWGSAIGRVGRSSVASSPQQIT